jgi:hypothetical protein
MLMINTLNLGKLDALLQKRLGDSCSLEDFFDGIDELTPSFLEFIKTLLQTQTWQNLLLNNAHLYQIALGLSQEIERFNAELASEPSYHSRKHFIDVTLTIHLLVSQNELLKKNGLANWLLSSEECWFLLICGIAHDYGHNGRINIEKNEQERRSIHLLQKFLQNQKLPSLSTFNEINDAVIVATDPVNRTSLNQRIASIQNQALSTIDKLSMLLIEADLTPSALPKRGVFLGFQLSKEFAAQNLALSEQVKSPMGRVNFLNSIQYLSGHSHLLGLDKLLEKSLTLAKENAKSN